MVSHHAASVLRVCSSHATMSIVVVAVIASIVVTMRMHIARSVHAGDRSGHVLVLFLPPCLHGGQCP